MALEDDVQQLVTEISRLVDTLRDLGRPPTAGRTGNDVDQLIRAMAQMTATLSQNNRTRRQEQATVEEFIRRVKSASSATDQQTQSSQDVVQANRAQARSTEDLTEEQRASEVALRKYRIEQDRARNFAGILAREKLAEAQANRSITRLLEQRAGEDVAAQMRIQQTINALGVLGDVAGKFKGFAAELAKGNTSFSTLNPIIDGLAGVMGKLLGSIPLAGGFLKGITEGAAEGFKFLISQLETASQTFNQLGQVGALTTQGMTGVQTQFLQSGLSLEGYRQIVTENAATLAKFGGTVGQGSAKFTAFLGAIIDSEAGDELRRIGFSADQIGESTAAFIAQQTRLGLSQNRSQAQLRQGSIEYAQELDRLAKLTGMQRKEIQAQQDAVLSEARFRAVYDEMVASGQEGQAKAMMDFQTMVNKASPEIGQGLRDMAAGFVNSEAAIKLFTTTGGAAADIMAQIKSGQIDQVTAFRMLQDATRQQMGVSRELAKAVGNETNRFVDYAQQSDFVNAKLIDGQVQLVRQQQEQMKKGTDPLTDSTVEAQKNLQQMSRQLSNFALSLMPAAASAVSGFTDILNRSIQKIAEVTGVELPAITRGGTRAAPPAAPTAPMISPEEVTGAAIMAEGGGGGISAIPGGAPHQRLAETIRRGGGSELVRVAGLTLDALGLRQEEKYKEPPRDIGDLFDFRGGETGNRENFERLDSGFRERLFQMATEYHQLTDGKKISFGSGHRTPEQNQAVGGVATSRHLAGQAADLTADVVNDLRNRGLLDKYGFRQNSNSGWHISNDGFRRGGIAMGPESGYTALLHGKEAVVPLPDGRAIPVQVKMTEINNPFADQATTSTPDIESAVDRMGQQIRQTMQDMMRGYNTSSALETALQELVSLQRSNNSTTERLLQVSVN